VASNGAEALRAMTSERFDVAIVDKNLDGNTHLPSAEDADGLRVIQRMREVDPDLEAVVMTAHATLESAVRAIQLGVFDYITKPFEQVTTVLHRIDRALEKRRRNLELRSLITVVATTNRQLSDAIATLHESFLENAKVMARLCELRDPPRAGEAERVRDLSALLARECGVGKTEQRWIETAALLHDLGEPNPYDTAELDQDLNGAAGGAGGPEGWRRHEPTPVRTMDLQPEALLSAVSDFDPVAQILRHHRERVDGKGNPDHLSADEIPLGSRILAVADAYVTLTSARPHRAALPHEQALHNVRAGSGTRFDPRVVAAMDRVLAVGREA
jgi:response regulator RpfG family c-di-GMP phosphodiesterase